MKTKIFYLLLAVFLISGVAACDNASPSSDEDGQSASKTELNMENVEKSDDEQEVEICLVK